MYNQISVFKNNKNLIEAIDAFRIGKIKLVIKDYSNGTGDKAKEVNAFVDIPTAGVFCNSILNNNFHGCEKVYGKDNAVYLVNEQKLLSKSTPDSEGRVPMRICQIIRDESMNLKYCVIIENGMATPEEIEGGGYKAKKGSYIKTSSLKKFLSEQDMNKMAFMILERIECHFFFESMTEIPKMSQSNES